MKNWLMLFVLAGLPACQTTDERIIDMGESIRHDDFVYSVRRVSNTDGSSRLNRANPENRLWLVVFRVDNQAKRVAHTWSDSTAYVTDSAGHRYENMAYARTGPKLTQAGQTDSTTLVFSLPKTLTRPYLQVRGETLMGDVFDGGQFEKTKIRLF